jgi:MFS family permease
VGRGAVLRIRDFRYFFIGRTVSTVGNAFTSVALAFGILASTHSAADIGYVLACRVAVQVALLLVGGAWSDRMPRRGVLIQSAFAAAATQAAIGVLFLTHTGRLWNLATVAALNGAVTAFSQPASYGVLPQIVPGELLQDANALDSIVRNSTSIGGAAVAGVLVAATGAGWALVIDAVTFALSGLLMTRMSRLPRTRSSTSVLADVRDGWREFTARTWVWAIVVQFTIVNMAITASFDVYAPLVSKLDYGGPAAYGAMSAAMGLGGVAGGLVMLRYAPLRPLLTATIGILVGVPFIGFLAAGVPLGAVIGGAGVAGLGVEVFSILWVSALQRHIPPERLSRVSAYDSLGSFAFMPIGLVLAGPVASALGGAHHALWLTTALIAAPTFAVLGVRDVRTIRREASDAAPASAGDAVDRADERVQ